MENKIIVLKPIAWNNTGYLRPEGIEKSGTDYVAKNGFGHEEWNGNPNRMWKQQRVFHTERTANLQKYGDRGELGIIMTAYRHGIAYALGVATSVKTNTDDERRQIALALKANAEAKAMWELPSVRKRKKNWQEFKEFWARECLWTGWRCPPSEYQWFSNPIPLNPAELFPPVKAGDRSPEIVKMYGRFQAIRPDQAISIVKNSLPANSPIIAWLSTGNFDQRVISAKTKKFGKPRPSPANGAGHSVPPPVDPYIRYVQQFEVQITPRHHNLQKLFENHIVSAGAKSIASDKAGVDLQFKLTGRGHVLAEIKPCESGTTRFAVRTAMGQLLDYKQRHPIQNVTLLVVLEARPTKEDAELALSNGFAVCYRRDTGFVFKWPG